MSLYSPSVKLVKQPHPVARGVLPGHLLVRLKLDLTSAFDTVDHKTLLSRLEYSVGIQGTVLSLFRSYLTNRTLSVKLGNF